MLLSICHLLFLNRRSLFFKLRFSLVSQLNTHMPASYDTVLSVPFAFATPIRERIIHYSELVCCSDYPDLIGQFQSFFFELFLIFCCHLYALPSCLLYFILCVLQLYFYYSTPLCLQNSKHLFRLFPFACFSAYLCRHRRF